MTLTSSPGLALRTVAILVTASLLAGCNSYFVRREALSYQSGDAVAWNRAIHTIDPWPAASRDTTIPVSGRRVVNAIENYENAKAAKADGPQPVVFAPVAPAAAADQ